MALAAVAVLAAVAPPAAAAARATAPALSAAVSPAAARPDFSGTWALDVARSDFGRVAGSTPPRARTDVVRQQGESLGVTTTIEKASGTMTLPVTYVIDGKQRTVRVGGQDVAATAAWAGDTLRLDTRAKVLLLELIVKERWVLAPGGRGMTILRHVKTPLGGGEQVLKFARK
ncbi:MAG: hypothetical protein HZC42_11610 [Candidatus Eisenbacteria bacterium]|nr:hypothetical protein [Candidatus Eisenbacteria bacterium]